MADDTSAADRDYTHGLRAAWADDQSHGVAAAMGLGVFCAIPRTEMFLRGYLALLRLPPARRQWFLSQMTTRGTGS